MQNVLILGAGKIGSLIACLLADSGDYHAHLADLHLADRPELTRLLAHAKQVTTVQMDAQDSDALRIFLLANPMQAMVSCLPCVS